MRIPYVYKLTDKETGKMYIGSRYSNTCNPNDLLVDYFTSSQVVKERINECGVEMFRKEILATGTAEEVLSIEAALQRDIPIEERGLYMNQRFGSFDKNSLQMSRTKRHNSRIAKGNSKPKKGRARQAAIENALKGAEARRGQKDSPEVRAKRAAAVKEAMKNVVQKKFYNTYVIEGEEYVGVEAVIKRYNVTRQTVWNRCKSEKHSDWVQTGRICI